MCVCVPHSRCVLTYFYRVVGARVDVWRQPSRRCERTSDFGFDYCVGPCRSAADIVERVAACGNRLTMHTMPQHIYEAQNIGKGSMN